MKVKKFQAETMPKAMKKVKQELGTDAVILNSKEVKSGGFLGLFKKKGIEVIAAKDPDTPQAPPKRSNPAKPSFQREPMEMTENSTQETALMKGLEDLKALIKSEKVDTSEVKGAYMELSDQELSSPIIEEIISRMSEGSSLKAETKKYLSDQAAQVPEASINKSKQFIHLIGPTGVGKTTTAAKLAADAALNEGLSVAFITTDTYRIAAIDQLRTYAKLLDVPMEVAYNIGDYLNAREKLKDKDLVIVDTAGRNYKDPSYVRELEQVIDFRKDAETILVLSMTSKLKDIEAVYHQFSSVPIHSLIFTKADESASYGAAISLCMNHQIGISYMTRGQSVPDDIETVSFPVLIDQLTTELSDE
ncbi:flagellar biosynthesis protein FlhF [Salimicrobium halophilum]|uniref:Flagellar biosynthesis protein FlhF n=1 Tax=Salimicrobium halophilum TaxID=86666 RepID=A0A1G8Q9R7_9BACI|nr:flagellar biosynthesis protein FlhF [Salimicrobium halophilum]SDJ01512.1 flagellar biosynthesis protein FlhF [Salimicrobium halophilum]